MQAYIERHRLRHTDREKDREAHRYTDRERHRQRDRQAHRGQRWATFDRPKDPTTRMKLSNNSYN